MKQLILLIVLVITGLKALSAQIASTEYRVVGIQAGDTLNVRSGPGMNYPIVARLLNGSAGIQAQDGPVVNGDDDWVSISIAGRSGWTRPKFLSPVSGLSEAARAARRAARQAAREASASSEEQVVPAHPDDGTKEAVPNKGAFQYAVTRNDLPNVVRYFRPEYVNEPFRQHPTDLREQPFPPAVHAACHGNTELLVFLAEHGADMKYQYNGVTLAIAAEATGSHDTCGGGCAIWL